jgi:hypothetical protein
MQFVDPSGDVSLFLIDLQQEQEGNDEQGCCQEHRDRLHGNTAAPARRRNASRNVSPNHPTLRPES